MTKNYINDTKKKEHFLNIIEKSSSSVSKNEGPMKNHVFVVGNSVNN